MRGVFLRLPEPLIEELDMRARQSGATRAEYIRRAVERMNQELARLERTSRLTRASQKVRESSMGINGELESSEGDDGT